MPTTNHQLIDDDEDYDLDDYYENTNQDSDKDSNWLFMVAGLLGGAFAVESLKPTGPRDSPNLASTATSIDDISDETFSTIMKSEIDPAKLDSSVENLQYAYTDAELEQYKQLGEELKQHGRIEDPRTIENKAMAWAENRNDSMGMFGDLEAYKSGALDDYITAVTEYGATIEIPWTCTGDNPCRDCLDLEAAGPYDPENYPEPPHFACCCNDPMAAPVITFPEEKVFAS